GTLGIIEEVMADEISVAILGEAPRRSRGAWIVTRTGREDHPTGRLEASRPGVLVGRPERPLSDGAFILRPIQRKIGALSLEPAFFSLRGNPSWTQTVICRTGRGASSTRRRSCGR